MSSTSAGGRTAAVVVAHADDETLGAGGTIAVLARAGWTVDVVIATDGMVPRVEGIADNRSAAAAACALLGVGPPRFLGLPDQRLDVVPSVELTALLAELPGDLDLVITHEPGDLNGDHRRVLEAVLVRWRPAPASPAVLGMEVVGSTDCGSSRFAPTFYVDVTTTLDEKVAALRSYDDELRPWPHPRSPEGVRAAAAYHGMHAGTVAAEAFQVIRARAGQLP